MKNTLPIGLLCLSIFVGVSACENENELTEKWVEENTPLTPSAGNLDVSTYIAVGNSLTAGFSDGALYPEGQANSYASIVGSQFKIVGGDDFIFPDISEGNGFGSVRQGTVFGKTQIDITKAQEALAGTATFSEVITPTMGSPLKESSFKGGDLRNFGVPGARVVDLLVNGYGNFNPFFGQFQTSSTTTILTDALQAEATFFSLWIGSNDVLGYALDGGSAGEEFNPMNPASMTSVGAFQNAFTATITALTGTGAKGIVLNIPPVTLIPNLQIIKSIFGSNNIITGLDAQTVAGINSGFAAYNNGLEMLAQGGLITETEKLSRLIEFDTVGNPPLIEDEYLTDLTSQGLPNYRMANETDLLPLTSLQVVGTTPDPLDPTQVIGISIPLQDEHILTIQEQTNIIVRTAEFNAVMSAIVSSNENLTLLDINPLFVDILGLTAAQASQLSLSSEAIARADGVAGIKVGSSNLVALSLTDIYNSLWSTDGVHPNPRGAALIANEIIKKINEIYSATIPLVNPLLYPAINAPLNSGG